MKKINLTGKCKEDFELYLINGNHNGLPGFNFDNYEIFWEYPESMQYGVLVNFFDSVGINIWTYTANNEVWWVAILTESRYLKNMSADDRYQARQKAIEKANELYNEKTKNLCKKK